MLEQMRMHAEMGLRTESPSHIGVYKTDHGNLSPNVTLGSILDHFQTEAKLRTTSGGSASVSDDGRLGTDVGGTRQRLVSTEVAAVSPYDFRHLLEPDSAPVSTFGSWVDIAPFDSAGLGLSPPSTQRSQHLASTDGASDITEGVIGQRHKREGQRPDGAASAVTRSKARMISTGSVASVSVGDSGGFVLPIVDETAATFIP